MGFRLGAYQEGEPGCWILEWRLCRLACLVGAVLQISIKIHFHVQDKNQRTPGSCCGWGATLELNSPGWLALAFAASSLTVADMVRSLLL